MRNLIQLSAIILLGLTFCKPKTSTTDIPEVTSDKLAVNQDDMNGISEKFIGLWELVEWTAESDAGERTFPFGEDAIGQISYDINGNMAVQIMKNNRFPFQSEDPLQGQPEEVTAAFNGFIAYSGKFAVDPETKQVKHQIEISSFPNWVGQDQFRYFEFGPDTLTLSTDMIGSSKHKLVWRKLNY